MRGPWIGVVLVGSAAGCPYVGARGVEDLRDVDGDDVVSVRFEGGRDCDDNDPAVGDCDADRDGHRGPGFGDDCDDGDPEVHPGAEELCAPVGRDEDCDGRADDADTVDDALKTAWFVDGDGDGFGADVPVLSCAAPPGTVDNDRDCDDTRSAISPAEEERCDAEDRDCDGDPVLGAVDAVDWYADADGDGFGRADGFVATACEAPAETGILAGGNLGDCDDQDAERHPAAQEVCNGLDDDCDGLVDQDDGSLVAWAWYLDEDGDALGQSGIFVRQCDAPGPDYTLAAGDCDDGDVNVSDVRTWYLDHDGDGFGKEGAAGLEVILQCAQPPGFALNDEDCDDERSAVNPVAQELCNGFDDNCDGAADDDDPDVAAGYPWYLDADGDGFGVLASGGSGPESPIYACLRPAGPWTGLAGDCDDGAPGVSPVIPERCNGVDDNCNGLADDNAVDQVTYYVDADSDGFGWDEDLGITGCPPAGVSLNASDCDDEDPDVKPSAPEVCDTPVPIDNDCDGLIDDADPNVQQNRHFRDGDDDGVGIPDVYVDQCVPPSGFAPLSGDCDDNDADVQHAVAFVPEQYGTVTEAVQRVCEGGAVLLEPVHGPYPVGGVLPRGMLIASAVAGERAAVCPATEALQTMVVVPDGAHLELLDLTIAGSGGECGPFVTPGWIRANPGSALTLDHVDGAGLAVRDALVSATGAEVTLNRVDVANVTFAPTSSASRPAVVSVTGGSLFVDGMSVDATEGRAFAVEDAEPTRIIDLQLRAVATGVDVAAVDLRRVDNAVIRAMDARLSGTALSVDRGAYQVTASRFAGTVDGKPPMRLCDSADVGVSSSQFVGGGPIQVLAGGTGCASLTGGLGQDPKHAFDGSVFAVMDTAFAGPVAPTSRFTVDASVFVAVEQVGATPWPVGASNVGLVCSQPCPAQLQPCSTQEAMAFVIAPDDICEPDEWGDVTPDRWILAPREGSSLLDSAAAEGGGWGLTAGRFPQAGWLTDGDDDTLPDAWEAFFGGDTTLLDPEQTCAGPETCVLGDGYEHGTWPMVPADAFPLRVLP